MDVFNEMSDEDFVPFLNSLGVETYKKSFEWMLNDADFSGVLRWLLDNLDHNNALTTREECRYTELSKKDKLFSEEELASQIRSIQEDFNGIPLPGDKDALDDLKMETRMYKDRFNKLVREEEVLDELIQQNERNKEELNKEVTKLHAAETQCKEDEQTSSEKSLKLSYRVERLTEDVVETIAETLQLYSNCYLDKEISKQLLLFGPFESYRQSQALFRSHFDLYASKKFGKRHNESRFNEHELRNVLVEAKGLEDRLTQAMLSYIESKAELEGVQARINLITNYEDLHPSQIELASMDAKSATLLLEEEESILSQQIECEVRRLVDRRTKMAVDSVFKMAYDVRETILSDLTSLHERTQSAHALDSALYYCLRRELRTSQDLLQFADDLAQYIRGEGDAVRSRIEAMTKITTEQDQCEQTLDERDKLLKTICEIIGANTADDVTTLVNKYGQVRTGIKSLKDKIEYHFGKKEAALGEYKTSQRDLANFIWDGSTKQPNCENGAVSTLFHAMKRDLDTTGKMVVDASGLFTTVKSGDKQNLRKLWQWFLTDQGKLLSVMKEVQSKSYS